MQVDKLFNVFHLSVHRQLHTTEDARNHLCTKIVVIVECPTDGRLPTLRLRFADVVEQCSPTQPKVVAMLSHVVDNLKRMVEVVLVGAAVAGLHYVESREFGNDELQESAALQLHEATAGLRRAHNHVELVGNALAAYNLNTFGVASESLEGLVVDVEAQLG